MRGWWETANWQTPLLASSKRRKNRPFRRGRGSATSAKNWQTPGRSKGDADHSTRTASEARQSDSGARDDGSRFDPRPLFIPTRRTWPAAPSTASAAALSRAASPTSTTATTSGACCCSQPKRSLVWSGATSARSAARAECAPRPTWTGRARRKAGRGRQPPPRAEARRTSTRFFRSICLIRLRQADPAIGVCQVLCKVFAIEWLNASLELPPLAQRQQ